MKKILLITLALLLAPVIYSQPDKDLAEKKKNKAIELMDTGSPDEGIMLLEEAKKLDPGTYIYDYEIGFAYTIKKDYPRALEIYRKVVKYDDATDQCYQMLGNLYDYNGDSDNAIKAYDKGLKKFPGSGKLYLEKGTVYWLHENYNEALINYEQGIKVDPSFPSNYYRAARLLCNSEDKVWGMLYGEIFLNLERNTKRTEEISKLLFDTYKSQIEFTSDTSVKVSFCKDAVINVTKDDLSHFDQIRLPFGPVIYETTLLLSIEGEHSVNLMSLNRIRQNFVSSYFEKEFNIKYPNVLFEFQKTLKDSGYMEPYNYWLLSSGDPENFGIWKDANGEAWDKFVDWFNNNGMILNEKNKFTRDQY